MEGTPDVMRDKGRAEEKERRGKVKESIDWEAYNVAVIFFLQKNTNTNRSLNPCLGV